VSWGFVLGICLLMFCCCMGGKGTLDIDGLEPTGTFDVTDRSWGFATLIGGIDILVGANGGGLLLLSVFGAAWSPFFFLVRFGGLTVGRVGSFAVVEAVEFAAVALGFLFLADEAVGDCCEFEAFLLSVVEEAVVGVADEIVGSGCVDGIVVDLVVAAFSEFGLAFLDRFGSGFGVAVAVAVAAAFAVAVAVAFEAFAPLLFAAVCFLALVALGFGSTGATGDLVCFLDSVVGDFFGSGEWGWDVD
jgi:hypothetical protein